MRHGLLTILKLRSPRRRLPCLVVLALATVLERRASATPSAKLLYVRNHGAETCPDEGEFRKAVAARLGYDPFFPWARTTVLATVERDGSGYQGRIEVLDERSTVLGRRTIATKGGDCGEVTRAMGLAVSVALDDLDLGAAPPLPEAPPPPPAPPAMETGPAPAPPALLREVPVPPAKDAAPTGEPIVLSGSLGPIASLGVAPAPSVGAALSVRARRGWLSLEVEGRADLPASGTYLGRTVSTNVIGGSLLVCAHPWRGLYACGVGFLASFAEHGANVPSSTAQAELFVGLGVRVGAEIPLGRRFFIDGHVDGLGALTGDSVDLGGHGVFEVHPFSATVGVAVGARF